MTINPNNYTGVSATVVGNVGGPAEWPAYDKNGSRGYKLLSVAVGQGYKKNGEWIDTGTAWYRYNAREDELADFGKGDKVRIDDAKLEVKEFTDRNGKIRPDLTLTFGTITLLDRPNLGGGDESPF